jgi:lysophospholipase L1-like esterase
VLAVIAAAVSFSGLWTVVAVHEATRQPTAARPVALRLLAPAPGRGVVGCERDLDGTQPRDAPHLVIVGASFTAGVGSGPAQSWAVELAQHLHWDAVIYGVPGAGYVRAGVGRQGPVAAQVARLGLRALKPSLIIVQAGHDDIGVSPAFERHRVNQTIASIRGAAPHARLVLLTVFSRRSPSLAAYRTDRAIAHAARTADRTAIIINPLTSGWRYSRARDGLHPTAAGSAWIASRVAAILRSHGVRPARIGAGQHPIICDRTYAAGVFRTWLVSNSPSTGRGSSSLAPGDRF